MTQKPPLGLNGAFRFRGDPSKLWRFERMWAVRDQSTYFVAEPSCLRMLRDCRSMLAVGSHQFSLEVRFSRSKHVHAEVTSWGQEWVLDQKTQCASLCACSSASFRSRFSTSTVENISTLLVNEEVAHMKCRLWGGRDIQSFFFCCFF